MSETSGRFVWYELMTGDAEAAQAFYGHVIGWTAQDAGVPGSSYTLFCADGAHVAGCTGYPPELPAAYGIPRWTGYLGVADVDTATLRLTQAGGHLRHGPADIPGIGRFAVVADPDGAGFTLFTPAPSAHAPPGGQVGWHELRAADGAAAMAYYGAQFGWKELRVFDMGPMGAYRIFTAAGQESGGIMTRHDDLPPHWLFYFSVDGIDAAGARVTEAGGTVKMGPTEVPGGSWVVQCSDPQGGTFALVSQQR